MKFLKQKILRIQKLPLDEALVYKVTVRPGWFARVFQRKKPYVVVLMDTEREYTCDSSTVYVLPDGRRLRNGNQLQKAVDNWRRSFKIRSNGE